MNVGNLRLIEAVAARQSAHDADGLAALFLPDGVFEDVPFDATARGHEEMKAFWTATWAAMPDFTMTLTRQFADGTHGGAEWIMSATQSGGFQGLPATGRSFSLRAATIVRFSDGRVAHWSDYWSLSSFKSQVGLG